jgi:predicted transcriptional regulator of viral defense system
MSSLTPKESEFLMKIAQRGFSIFPFEQVQEFWSPPERASDVLYRLVQKGWLRRLERGLYLIIPLEAGPARAWTESGLIIAGYLTDPAAIAYWSALHFWNLTEQIPGVIFVQTTRRKQQTEIAGMRFRFVTVVEDHFFGVTTVNVGGKTAPVTDLEKTIVDCAACPDLSGGILQLAQVLKSNSSQINWEKLDQYLRRWGGGTVVKRLGYLVETLKLPNQEERLTGWQSLLTRGVFPLEPGAGNDGSIRARRQVSVNVPVVESFIR